MNLIIIALSIVAIITAFIDWRKGLLFVLIIGVLQDPFRKLSPNISSLFIIWSLSIFCFVFLAAFLKGETGKFKTLYLHSYGLKNLWSLWAFLLFLQFFHSFFRWNVIIPVIGSVEYIMPLFALLLGLGFAQTEKTIIRFVSYYIMIIVPAALTVYLSVWYGDQWSVLREIGSFVGNQLIIYDIHTALESYSGIFRTGEIASWHAATSVMFLLFLVQKKTSFTLRVVAMLLIFFLIGAIIYTGRRKMLMSIVIFFVLRTMLIAKIKGNLQNIFIPLLFLLLLGAAGLNWNYSLSSYNPYIQRGVTVFGATPERFRTAIDLFRSATSRSMGLGLGLRYW